MSPSRQLLLLHRHYHRRRRHVSSPPQEQWSLRTVLQLLSSDQLTCEALSRYCHATAVAGEAVFQLGAFSRLTALEQVQEQARAADERRRQGHPKSLLDGIPISIKANLAVEDQALTAGSRILGESSDATAAVGSVGYNAELVRQLVEDCGAVCIGITNMDEFGMGSLGTNTARGTSSATKNPLTFLPSNSDVSTGNASSESPLLLDILQQSAEDITAAHQDCINANNNANSEADPYYYSAGGSSCGAAASVAHGSSLIALASDTGGSIRLPAAWCGVVGLKPSYGRVSRHGLVSYASSLDTVGYMTPTVDCASLVLKELRSKERQPPQDSTHHFFVNGGVEEIQGTATTDSNDERPLKGIQIGIPAAFVVDECPDAVKEVWTQGAAQLEQAGATLVNLSTDVVSPDVIQQSLAAYYVLASAEASSNLARYDGFRYGVASTATINGGDHASSPSSNNADARGEGTALQQQYAKTRTQGFGPEVIRRILCGTAVLSSDKFHSHYEAAARLRALVTQQLHDALTTHVDYLLIPTVLSPPPRLRAAAEGDNTASVDSTEMFGNDIMTVPISLAGLAAVNVPFNLNSTDGGSPAAEAVTGLQLVGYRLQEENLLRVARHLEAAE